MPLPSNLSKTIKKSSAFSDSQRFPQQVSSVSVSKEKGSLSEEKILEEVRAGIEMEISKELKEAGVEKVAETIELPQKVAKETGMIEVGEELPVSTTLTFKLPLDDKKIKIGLKKSIVDSILWLAHWCLRQIKIAKFKALKLVGVKLETKLE